MKKCACGVRTLSLQTDDHGLNSNEGSPSSSAGGERDTTALVPHGGTQVLVKWAGLELDAATWERWGAVRLQRGARRAWQQYATTNAPLPRAPPLEQRAAQ